MRIKQLFLILALLCTVAQGAWAQANWEEVYAMTNTTTSDWAQLSGGSTTGRTLGAAGTTTYYYANSDLTFTNSTEGGSGMTILGSVYLYVPQSVTITCTGADADGATGAGAGIELTEGNALYLLGSGTVNATGGNAADGANGAGGGDANWDSSNYWSGTGGTGGHGGGGAGAGIGTRGGQGGQGGAGAANKTSAWSTAFGGNGSNGEAGATAGSMGGLCVSTSFGNVTATGGAAASQGGSAGSAGKSAFYDGSSNNYSAAGGGGGGGGGFGGAATGIGTGGPGGGGGGGGASSNLDYAASGYYVVKAPGGKGGQNVDGTWAAAGAEGIMNHNGFKTGLVKTNGSGWEDDYWNYDSYVSTQGVGIGGSGSAAGNASISESAISITTNTVPPTQEEWDVVCRQTNTNQSQWTALPFGTSMGVTIGTAGTTTYYYATGDRTFINSNAGGSGLTILGTVYLFVASGQTITCKGANAGGQTGAGAGIELTEGNVLFLLGQGNVNATGGNAAGGGNGTNGSDAGWDNSNYWSGTGGSGGNGGGGAGAGIGTRGGLGGQGGAGAESVVSAYSTAGGGSGSGGTAGATAGSMGELYVVQSFGSLSATGGAAASRGGSAGSAGKSILDDDTSNNYGAAGGGGGGGGGFGGAASNIGTGGPGGGGGGGGVSGNLDWAGTGYYVVKAPGGKGGQNVDGTWAGNGAESILNYNNLNNGQAYSNSSKWDNYDSSASSQAVGTGGSGGAAGAASTSEQATTVNMKQPTQDEWDMVCRQTQTSQSQWRTLPLGVRKGATIGAAGTTTYYLATYDRSFTNSTVGGSGLTILGTVYLFIASGQTIACQGANASGTLGAGAGIELAVGNTLYLIGGGKLVATGGNAANGAGGSNGADASFDDGGWSGGGGRGGDGGGGAGAGIGTRGGTGGTGGTGGARMQGDNKPGNVGSNGADGGTAADMGSLYIYPNSSLTTEIHGGSGGTTGGSGGTTGLHALKTIKKYGAHQTYVYDGATTMGSGAGGAGGGFGGAASDIGTGGSGGGGGGGGASGSIITTNTGRHFYQVGALGGRPGANADGTLADAGENSQINSDQSNVVFDDRTATYTNDGWAGGQDNRAAGGTGGNTGSAAKSGTPYLVPASISLADNADNSATINTAKGYLADVTLQGRTLYKDGSWNTLCLPFSVDNFIGTPLEGATVKTLASTSFTGGTLTMNFSDDVTSMEAGKPYIVMWANGTDIENPVFTGVTISNVTANAETDYVDFVGTYNPVSIYTDEKTNLYLGADNTLYYPTDENFTVNAFRGYFQLKGLTAGETNSAGIRNFVLNFGDGDNATGIVSAEAISSLFTIHSSLSEWYTLDGRKLSGKPTQRGIYVHGGKKVVVK